MNIFQKTVLGSWIMVWLLFSYSFSFWESGENRHTSIQETKNHQFLPYKTEKDIAQEYITSNNEYNQIRSINKFIIE